jgi:integrase
MERPKRPYSTQKRPTILKHRFIYYIKFRNPDSGEYLTAVSSGCTSRAAASNWADEQIKSGKIRSYAMGRITFETLAKGFWDYDTSPYIQGKLARGDSQSRGYASISAGYCRKYLIPTFGMKVIDTLKPVDFERWILSLSKEHSFSTASVNQVYTCLRVMIREAIRLGYLEKDLTEKVRLVRESSAEKGILTLAEVRKLFGKDALSQCWGNDLFAMTANALAASTGLRLGEVRGLTLGYLHEDHIEVLHSWEESFGLKELKRGSVRIVPITASLYASLNAIAKLHGLVQSDQLVFCGSKPEVPVSKWCLPHKLEEALSSMGIKKETQRERGITFHSWRHFFNSMLRGKLPDEKLKLMTGHKTEEMTERYSHALPEDFKKCVIYRKKFLYHRMDH